MSDAGWLSEQGVTVRRLSLSSDTAVFLQTPVILRIIRTMGMGALPALLVDGWILRSVRATVPVWGEPAFRFPLSHWDAVG